MVRLVQRGFTLLEMLLVLMLLGMMYALLPPMFASGGSVTELKAAARQVAAGLRKARGQAIADRQESTLSIDVDAKKFQLSGDPKVYSLPGAASVSVQTADSEVYAENLASIRFYPDGGSTGGRVTLAMGARAFMVDVDWLTGRVEILDQP